MGVTKMGEAASRMFPAGISLGHLAGAIVAAFADTNSAIPVRIKESEPTGQRRNGETVSE